MGQLAGWPSRWCQWQILRHAADEAYTNPFTAAYSDGPGFRLKPEPVYSFARESKKTMYMSDKF